MTRQEQATRTVLPAPPGPRHAAHSPHGHTHQGQHVRRRWGRLRHAHQHVAALDHRTRHVLYTAGTTLAALVMAMLYIAITLHR